MVSIDNRAFQSCYRVTYLELPSTLSSIGEYNFEYDNTTIVSRAVTPPTIAGGCENKLFYVPAGSSAAYRELYPNNIFVDGEGTELAVTVTEAGTFGEEALKLTNSLSCINRLKITGKLNNNDIECIRNNMSNLIAIDMSGVDMEVIPSSFLSGKKNIMSLVLPSNTKEISQNAFSNCGRLKEIKLPETLTTIYSNAFSSTGLTSIDIPESVTTIGNHAFYDCNHLVSVTLPSTITRIEEYTFHNCSSLKSIALPQQITYIGQYAFQGCSSLTSITLPQELTEINYYTFNNCSSLISVEIPSKVNTIHNYAFQQCNNLETVTIGANVKNIRENAFQYCNNLKNITCQALFPPSTNGSIVPNSTCVLYVPEWTLVKYKLASNWGSFTQIEPISGIYPSDIYIFNEESLDIPDTGMPQGYKPNLFIENQGYDYMYNSGVGRFTVKGTMPLTLSTFEMEQSIGYASPMTALLNKGSMSADNVVIKLNAQVHNWNFLSFPYDVKISDIVADGDWVIRYYDGALRAQGDYDNTWQNVPYDSILHAGVGYIWHSTNGYFEVPAMDNTNKYLIFSNETRYVQLNGNVSSNAADNGWNLIGNPYPCFFDTRFMEFTSPITVRNGSSYTAYSPVDDSYILSPLEAFFVQCSGNNNLLGFNADGRQINSALREASAPRRTRGVSSNRRVFNLYLENESYADHTRFVINEEAALDYEIAYDAAKFMSDDPAVHQLFTMENGERMAINERPMANGEVALGVYVGKAGTYTFSLDTRVNDTEVVLVDKLTGTTTDLMTSDYTFTAEAGTLTDRFVVCMKSDVLSGIANTTSAARVKIATTEGLISVSHANAPVQVYDAAGTLVGTKSGDEVTFEVAPGIYMVKVGSKVHKISVVK